MLSVARKNLDSLKIKKTSGLLSNLGTKNPLRKASMMKCCFKDEKILHKFQNIQNTKRPFKKSEKSKDYVVSDIVICWENRDL